MLMLPARPPQRPSRPPTSVAARKRSVLPAAARFESIDGLRGCAVAMMVAYHFCYDLVWFGWAQWRIFDDPAWIAWRSVIVGLFLLLVGVSLTLRDFFQTPASDFWKRWAQIAAAALCVSLGSWLFAGDRFIYFGILHFIALALLIGRALLAWPPSTRMLGLGTLAILTLGLGLIFTHPMFNPMALNWLGFATQKPATEDYVPLMPWLGVVLLGMVLGLLWIRDGFPGAQQRWPAWLRWLGRWSLTIYLTHQLVLIGLLWGIKAFII